MVRHTRIPVPMPTNSPADMRTAPSPAGLGPTCRKKRHRPLPKRSLTLQKADQHSGWMLHKSSASRNQRGPPTQLEGKLAAAPRRKYFALKR
jgi:hypothetical protein